MKNEIKKYLENNKKQTEKMLKKIFGINSIVEGIKEEEQLKLELEKICHKEIDLIDWQIIEENYNSHKGYIYVKYITLQTLITQYLENKKLYPYTNDLQEVVNEY